MTAAHYDIVHAADPRYRGGASSALRGEIEAAARWGLKAAVLPYFGGNGSLASGFEPRVRSALDKAGLDIISAETEASCDILLAHHPFVFENMPAARIRLRPKRVVCVLHHPPFDGLRQPYYDLERVIATLEASFATTVHLAPISSMVRDQLTRIDVAAEKVLPHDLWNVVDEADWPMRTRPAPRGRAVIGRHSRADPLKWPDTPAEVLAAYPEAAHLDIRVLGDVRLPEGMACPTHWTTLPFATEGVADFLASLDFYVFFHSRRWIEAFGIALAEAMLAGLVTILPPEFEPLFGDGAVYARPDEVRGIVEMFLARPDEYARQSRTARRVAMARFSIAAYGGRLQRLYDDLGLPPPDHIHDRGVQSGASPPAGAGGRFRALPRQRVLMVTSNGIGLGHVTRLMAVARHLPPAIEPVFLTLSLATSLLREAGYDATYIPSASKSGVTAASWNGVFTLELLAAIDAAKASAVILDSNDPFPGLLRAMALRRDLSWIWIRRGLWQPDHSLDLKLQYRFDMVIEPGELAGLEDGGPTALQRDVQKVGPILMTEPDERAGREEAAAMLGVDPNRRTVAIQLGSRQNFDIGPLRGALFRALSGHDATVIEIANPLAPAEAPLPFAPPLRTAYPLFRWSRAIDLLVAAPGYNSFHESMLGAIPTIFVPNETPTMDDQTLRANYAHAAGLGLLLRAADWARVGPVLAEGLSDAFAADMKARAARIAYKSGAAEAAELIAELLISVRTDRRLADALPRGR